MLEVTQQFINKGYAYLPEFLDTENCAELTNELKNLVSKGVTTKDVQCPLSEAVHGAEVFDSLLEQLLPNFEKASGKRLLPTYAYARLYKPGEELKIHTDRPACEISATLTLGFEGSPWPIFMADYAENENGEKVITQQEEIKYIKNEDKIVMNIGDAVLYRGMEKAHWRNKYVEGHWQAQVFLHYVDADGPHADEKYDKRKTLSHKKQYTQELYWWHFSDALAKDSCKKLIESIEGQLEGVEAGVGPDGQASINKTVRDVKAINLPTYRGIGATMVGLGISANQQAWKFDVTHANQTDYLRYDADGHYLAHIDTFLQNIPETRKLTILVFLNDDFEGGRLFIQMGHEKLYPPQEAGTCLVFPSFLMHGVEPVTKGVRRSIVTWLVGPWFK